MKAAYFYFGVALLFPFIVGAQISPVVISNIVEKNKPNSDAKKYVDMVKINCLPEIGVLQINVNDFKVGDVNQEAFYLHKESREKRLETRRMYHFREGENKQVARVCVINGTKVSVRLEDVRCVSDALNAPKLDENETYPADCIGAAVSIRVDNKLWVNNLNLQKTVDYKKINSIEIGRPTSPKGDNDLAMRINFIAGRDQLPDEIKHPKASVSSDMMYSVVYPEQKFSDGFVVNNDNFWGE